MPESLSVQRTITKEEAPGKIVILATRGFVKPQHLRVDKNDIRIPPVLMETIGFIETAREDITFGSILQGIFRQSWSKVTYDAGRYLVTEITKENEIRVLELPELTLLRKRVEASRIVATFLIT